MRTSADLEPISRYQVSAVSLQPSAGFRSVALFIRTSNFHFTTQMVHPVFLRMEASILATRITIKFKFSRSRKSKFHCFGFRFFCLPPFSRPICSHYTLGRSKHNGIISDSPSYFPGAGRVIYRDVEHAQLVKPYKGGLSSGFYHLSYFSGAGCESQ